MATSMLDDQWTYGSDADTMASVIRDGRLESGMPGYGEVLSDKEIRSLVIFINEQNAQAKPPMGPEPIGDEVYRSEKHDFRIETVVEDLDLPWSLAFFPDGNLLISERPGTLLVVNPKSGHREAIAGIPEVYARGQGGLLDVEVDPDYKKNGWIYLSFSDPGESGNESMTAIVRGRIRDGIWEDEEQIFRAPGDAYTGRNVHFGCRLVFDGDYLFFTIGDRGRQDDAQDLSVPNGKTHRIYKDGRIPADNPFVGKEGASPSIWTYGNRNAQGLALDPKTGKLWETEHGPRGGDELNLIKKGRNYGWPIVTHGMNYNGTPITGKISDPTMEDPVTYWTPSLAVCGLDVYHGSAFPKWDGALLSSALRAQELRLIILSGESVSSQEVLVKDKGRIRDTVVGPDGLVYLILNSPNKIVKLVP